MTKYLFYKCVSYNVHPTFLVKDTHGRELIFATEVHFQGDGYYSNEFHDIYVLHPHFFFFYLLVFFLQKILVTVCQKAVMHLKQATKQSQLMSSVIVLHFSN